MQNLLKMARLGAALPKYFRTQHIFKKTIKYHSDLETVIKLKDRKTSISRFGDGEFDWILGIGQETGFQKNDKDLETELRRVINESDGVNHVVGIPRQLFSIKEENDLNRFFWIRAIKARGLKWMQLLNPTKEYWSSTFSRSYIGVKDKGFAMQIFSEAKKIWKGRDVLIVEGGLTRFAVNSDLLEDANEVYRIIGPAENAFSSRKEIEKKIIEFLNDKNDVLILLALGPTATVLSFELSKKGYQAVDIGHLDMEYIWYQMGVSEPKDIPWKYMNELDGGDVNRDAFDDNEYHNQIVDRIL